MPRLLRLVAAPAIAVALCAGAWVPAARAAEDPPSPVTVLPAGDLVLTADSPGGPPVVAADARRSAVLTLLNTTATPATVTVTAALAAPAAGDVAAGTGGAGTGAGAAGDGTRAAEVTLATGSSTGQGRLVLEVVPGTMRSITVSTAATSGSGALVAHVVSSAGARLIVRRTLAVAVTPRPAVPTWAVDVRGATSRPLAADGATSVTLPASGPCPVNWIGPPVTLVGAGTTAAAEVRCAAGALTVALPPLPPGSYSGRLSVGGGTVDVGVVRAAGWVWPLGLAALGAALALGQRTAAGRGQRAGAARAGRAAGPAAVALAAAAAVWGGLLLWYRDEPWGSAADLVTALAWGYGVTVLAGLVLDAAARRETSPGRPAPEPAAPRGGP